jgi:hypothetical protein
MSAVRPLILVLGLLCSGCFGNSLHPVTMGDGTQRFVLSCRSVDGCYRLATHACPGGYVRTNDDNFPERAKRWMIQCTNRGER